MATQKQTRTSQPSKPKPTKSPTPPYTPTLILHGGAGSISRTALPPSLYDLYHASLLSYLTSTKHLLDNGASALDAACHAVALMEDDELFNCGRGSVFNREGAVEMEASLMVSCIAGDSGAGYGYDGGGGTGAGAGEVDYESYDGRALTNDKSRKPAQPGTTKRGAAVSLVRNTRHPILLAKEVLCAADGSRGWGGMETMHCHLSGTEVEEWGFGKGLERKEDAWFWTRRRWEEHRRGMEPGKEGERADGKAQGLQEGKERVHGYKKGDEEVLLPSQGTVGAVCLDRWGNLAVATSTGGLTNKSPGRIGDTPTLGAGFWAESWAERDDINNNNNEDGGGGDYDDDKDHENDEGTAAWVGGRSLESLLLSLPLVDAISDMISDCMPSVLPLVRQRHGDARLDVDVDVGDRDSKAGLLMSQRKPEYVQLSPVPQSTSSTPPISQHQLRRRAVAMSGTGNGDSFLRTNAVRTAAAICRFSSPKTSLAEAVHAIAGQGGELQHSAGDRFGSTGEGDGGIIGIEVTGPVGGGDGDGDEGEDGRTGRRTAEVVFDFNCSALWRAYYRVDRDSGREVPEIRVFREEY